MVNRTFNSGGLFPDLKQRFESGTETVRENPAWKHKGKIALGVLGVWTIVSFLEPFSKGGSIPTPIDTADAIGDWLDGLREPSSSDSSVAANSTQTTIASSETVVVTPSTTESTTQSSQAALPTLPVINTPETSTLEQTATTQTPTTLAQISEALPNPMQYSVNAGSVVCTGEILTINVNLDEGAPLRQLQNATGEGWAESATQGPNPLDENLFSEVMQYAVPVGNNIYEVPVRTGCVGLEK